MKRIAAILLALAIPTVIVAALIFLLYKPGLPDSGRQALELYINDAVASSQSPIQAHQIVQASNPRALTAEMSAASYGDGSYFVMSHDLNTNNLTGDNLRFLPFPPQELWCALLTKQQQPLRIVFIAEHEDLYRAIWVIHETSDDLAADTTTNILAQVGCVFGK